MKQQTPKVQRFLVLWLMFYTTTPFWKGVLLFHKDLGPLFLGYEVKQQKGEQQSIHLYVW